MAESNEVDTERRRRRDPRQDVELLADVATEAATEFHRLVVAMSAANTSLITGTVQIMSDMLLGTPRSSGSPPPRVEGVGGRVSRAMADHARLVQETAGRFAERYESSQTSDIRYEDRSLAQLRELAREREIKGASEMTKADLVRALRDSDRAA